MGFSNLTNNVSKVYVGFIAWQREKNSIDRGKEDKEKPQEEEKEKGWTCDKCRPKTRERKKQ